MATMSHELRTPLNAILGFSDILLHQLRPQGLPWQLHMLERILANGQHLLTLIEEVLDFSKLRSHRLELHLQPLNLSELLTATVTDLRPLAAQKNIELDLELPSIPATIVNDPLRLRQVVMNLLSNSIKFTDVGHVSVSVLELPENRLAIVVRDTGIGIDAADQANIFQEFWQVNQTRTRTQGGTGLGLAITKALVELMQGSISLESQVGKGSVFRVEIPRQIFQNGGN